MIPALTPTFDIAIQGKYLPLEFLAGTGAGNRAIVLQGSQVGVPFTISQEAFLSLTPDDVTAAFERADPVADRMTTDTVVLDMEPTWGRPQFWYRQPLAFFHQLKMICDTIRTILPNCRLSLWAFFPPTLGDLNAGNWIGQEFQGYLTAGRIGVYGSLSYLCVVLRSPYVPADRAYHKTRAWLATGLAAASTLKTPLLGFLGFDNVNGSSAGYQKPYPVQTLQMQMQAARDGGCLSCVLWGADQSRVNRGIVKSLAAALRQESSMLTQKIPASPAIVPVLASGSAERTGVPAFPKLVFTSGCFDLFHAGHVDLLRQAKQFGDRLIVGVNSDASVRRLKGPARPVIPQEQRARIVAACRYVDEVHLFDELTPCELVRRLQPAVIVKGPGYCEANMPEAAAVKQWGGRVVIVSGPTISTTAIIGRIAQAASD